MGRPATATTTPWAGGTTARRRPSTPSCGRWARPTNGPGRRATSPCSSSGRGRRRRSPARPSSTPRTAAEVRLDAAPPPARPPPRLPRAQPPRRRARTTVVVSPGPVPPARPTRPRGDGRCSSTPCARRPAGGWATWPTSAAWPRGRPTSWGRGWSWSTPSTPPCPASPRRPAPTSRAAAASATRSTCGWRTCPGAADALGDRLDQLAAAGRALNAERRSTGTRCGGSSSTPSTRSGTHFPGDPAFDRWRDGEGGGALDAYATFCALAEEHGGDWRAWPEELPPPRPAPRWRRFGGRTRTGCGSTSGCSGCSTASWSRRRRRAWPSCTTWPSASTRAAPTPGCGRTCSPSTWPWAPRPTSSTPGARTGACPRSTRGGCGRPATSPSWRRSGPPSATPAACASTT